MIDLQALTERHHTEHTATCDCCGQPEQSHRIERWTDGDGLSWLCRDCLRSAVHEHDAAIADRAADMLEHGAAFFCECGEGAL